MERDVMERDFWGAGEEYKTPEKAFMEGELAVRIRDFADLQAVQKKLDMLTLHRNQYAGFLYENWLNLESELCVWKNGGGISCGCVEQAEAETKHMAMEAVTFAAECYKKPEGNCTTGTDKRKGILTDAETCVCTDRNLLYGELENSFRTISVYWQEYLNTHCLRDGTVVIEEVDSMNMMILFKMARITTAKKASRDSYVDLAGYAAIAGGTVEE